MFQKLLLALAPCLSFALTGCLGGASATPGGTASSSGTGPTPPVRLESAGLDVIHLEATDPFWYNRTGSNEYRDALVCPGVPPRGNECFVDDKQSTASRERYDVDFFAQNILASGSLTTWSGAQTQFSNEVAAALGFFRTSDSSTTSGAVGEALAGFGQHSAITTYTIPTSNWVAQTISAAMGELHDGRPAYSGPNEPSGSATWRGAMVGTDMRRSSKLVGNAALVYSFVDNTIDVDITNIRKDTTAGMTSYGDYNGPNSFSWPDLPVNSDASFYIRGYGNDRSGTGLHPTLGYIDGDFYGPNAEEAAGVFERDWVSGAWLAIRESDEE